MTAHDGGLASCIRMHSNGCSQITLWWSTSASPLQMPWVRGSEHVHLTNLRGKLGSFSEQDVQCDGWFLAVSQWSTTSRETMRNHEKTMRNHEKTMRIPWENHEKTMRKPWENHGKPLVLFASQCYFPWRFYRSWLFMRHLVSESPWTSKALLVAVKPSKRARSHVQQISQKLYLQQPVNNHSGDLQNTHSDIDQPEVCWDDIYQPKISESQLKKDPHFSRFFLDLRPLRKFFWSERRKLATQGTDNAMYTDGSKTMS